jgi:hypothetical protein
MSFSQRPSIIPSAFVWHSTVHPGFIEHKQMNSIKKSQCTSAREEVFNHKNPYRTLQPFRPRKMTQQQNRKKKQA